MKATGIVRRIDDLGRVVVPKEIRRILRIREGDPLEIYTGNGGEVILKKYSPISELGQFAGEYCDTASAILDSIVIVSDTDHVVAASGVKKSDYVDRKIDNELDRIIQSKSSVHDHHKAIVPILVHGDPIGSVTILPKANMQLSETEFKAAEIGASFLGKQIEH